MSISISDISEFAEWEASHPSQVIEERDQSLIDMARPDRVWVDRDSSNDARSSWDLSDSDSDCESDVEQVEPDLPRRSIARPVLGIGGSTAKRERQSSVRLCPGRSMVSSPLGERRVLIEFDWLGSGS